MTYQAQACAKGWGGGAGSIPNSWNKEAPVSPWERLGGYGRVTLAEESGDHSGEALQAQYRQLVSEFGEITDVHPRHG